MKPSIALNKPIIGKLITRKIDSLFLEKQKASIDQEKEYDVIEVAQHEGNPIYLVDEWSEDGESIRFIHNNFVKKYYPKEKLK